MASWNVDLYPGHGIGRISMAGDQFVMVRLTMTTLFLLAMLGSTAGQVILDGPKDITVFPNHEAVFHCFTRDVSSINWMINDTDLDDIPSTLRDDLIPDSSRNQGFQLFTLNITGRVEYNGTRIRCVIAGNDENTTATLYIQGTLSSVADLRTSDNATSVTIYWTAPFSLDVTGVDPDIWYSVLIYINVTDEPTAVPCTDCMDITETHYTFTPDYPSPCQEYIFTVIPLNGAGQGETSHNVSGYTINDPSLNFIVAKPVITAMGPSYFQVIFNISGDVSSVCTCSLRGGNNNPIKNATDELEIYGPDKGAVIYILPTNVNCTSFEIRNAAKSITMSDFAFTTFDVQNVTATSTGSKIFINGTFATNSTAKGLFVVLQCDDGSPDEFRALLSEGNREHDVTVPSSTYTILVYDLEHTALPSERVAFMPAGKLTVENGNQTTKTTTSVLIKDASISISGSTVQITCELSEDYPESSCVLVYREYGNTTLVVEEYTHNNKPSDNITLDNPNSNYTLAVFGKNGSAGIDPKPVTTKRYMNVATTSATTEEPSVTVPHPSDEQSSQRGPVVGVAVGVPVAMIAVMLLLIVLILIMLMRKKRLTIPKSPRSPVIPNPSLEDALEYHNEDSRSSAWTMTPPDGPPEEEESKYASVMVAFAATSLPIVDPPVQYSEVDLKATKRQAHPHGLHYAELGAPPPYSKRPSKPPSTKSTTHYVDILPHSIPTDNTASDTKETNKEMEKKKEEKPVKKSVPVTVEAVMSLLLGVAGLWKAIAEGLGFEEDLIDEIYTNDDTDEACLQNCVEQWINKLDPTWQKLSHVLSDMGQESLAQKALQNEGFAALSKESADSGDDITTMFVSGQRQQQHVTGYEEETREFKATQGNKGNWDRSVYTIKVFSILEQKQTCSGFQEKLSTQNTTVEWKNLSVHSAVNESDNNASLAVYGRSTCTLHVSTNAVFSIAVSFGGLVKFSGSVCMHTSGLEEDIAAPLPIPLEVKLCYEHNKRGKKVKQPGTSKIARLLQPLCEPTMKKTHRQKHGKVNQCWWKWPCSEPPGDYHSH